MAMTGFICHDDYLSKTAKLTDEELGRLFRALMVYHATGDETDLDLRESIAFDFIREDIDRTEKKYRDKCDKNREIRLSAVENERKRTLTNVNERDQYKEKEEEKEKENNNKTVKKRFEPPTLEMVAEYCKERNNGINPQHFIDYYQARGWELKPGQKMKDFRACIRTWEERQKTRPVTPVKKPSSQDYTQRDYSEPSEDMDSVLTMIAGRVAT